MILEKVQDELHCRPIDKKLLAKAKKRIKTFLLSGTHQARVHSVLGDPSIIDYRVGPGQVYIRFKVGKNNRLVRKG